MHMLSWELIRILTVKKCLQRTQESMFVGTVYPISLGSAQSFNEIKRKKCGEYPYSYKHTMNACFTLKNYFKK